MNGISGYQSAYYQTSQVKAPQDQAKSQETKKSQKKDSPLSQKAKNYINTLKKKYNNIDFIVADYETEEEAKQYLSKLSNKEYSCLIDTETLEKMASDSKTREQYESVLSGAGLKFDQMKKELGEDAKKVTSFGITIDKAGIVSYFAEIEKSKARINKQKEEQLAAKEAEKKTEEKKAKQKKESDQTVSVKADSIEELVAKIRENLYDTNQKSFQTEQEKIIGQNVDFKF